MAIYPKDTPNFYWASADPSAGHDEFRNTGMFLPFLEPDVNKPDAQLIGGDGWKQCNGNAQNFEKAIPHMHDRFRKMIEETWSELTMLRQSYRNLENMAIYKDDESSKALDADAVTDFVAKFTQLIKLRDDPDTPFMVSHMIDVDTCVYGATDEGSVLIYEWGQDSSIITDPLVLEEMRQNDRWMNEYGYSENSHNPDEQQIRRDDELAMSRVHNRVDLEDDATTYLLKYAGLYHYVNHAFGFEVTSLSEPAKLRLIDYLTTVSKKDIERISAITERLSQEALPKFAEAFLATEFGDDFGDTLLTVAEKLPQEQLVPLLDTIQSIREYGAKFAKEFSGFDGKINNSIKAAIGERITEVLYVVKELAITVEGTASGKVLGNRITVKNMVEVMDALSLIELGLQRKSEAEESGVVTSAYDEDNRTAWHLGTESDVLVQVKKRGERRGEYKKGLEHSEEAQINYSIDVLSRDGDYVPTQIANYRRRYALSIRLDLEGILRDKNGGKVGFDATHDQLTAALDIGSLRGAADNPNVRVARIISLGNKLRKRDLRQGRSLGYHTGLPEEYGNKVKFAGLAEFMIAKYRHRALGRGVVASALDQSPHQSSVSRSGRAAA